MARWRTPPRLSGGQGDDVRYRVLSPVTIAAWAVLIVLVGAGMVMWLLLAYTSGDTEANRVQLDAIRTAGTIVVGTGGAAALLLAARRQRSTEIALKQKDRDQADAARAHALQEQIAATTAADAEARRITELYGKAVEQLGSDKAPVRLGGLYALERLAQDNPTQRQTIVNVLCSYLRMPYTIPDDTPTADTEPQLITDHRERMQEREVRLTSQRILIDHLDPGNPLDDAPPPTFWPDMDVSLTGATLIDFSAMGCRVRFASFSGARFIGDALFTETQFTGAALFTGTQFTGAADFAEAQFSGVANFDEAQFSGTALFTDAQFAGTAYFVRAQFTRAAEFAEAQFIGTAHFTGTQFTEVAYFIGARFTSAASFGMAQFAEDAYFAGVRFTTGVPDEVASFHVPPSGGGR